MIYLFEAKMCSKQIQYYPVDKLKQPVTLAIK